MNGITQKQTAVLRYIHTFTAAHDYPPSIREIGEHMRISALRGVTNHLDALVKKGYLERTPVRARCLTLTEKGRRAIDAHCACQDALRERLVVEVEYWEGLGNIRVTAASVAERLKWLLLVEG
jgi:DNA-binding MarR family transcriptional regulator